VSLTRGTAACNIRQTEPVNFKVITEMPAYKLVSATIMHRHGARGPGESELSPWDESSRIFTQWDEKDLEVINRPGHVQMGALGIWFAEYITRHGLLNDPSSCEVLWRCSKSDRAKESGEDFVSSVNDSLGQKVIITTASSIIHVILTQ